MKSIRELRTNGERIGREIQKEWILLQDKYDSEVYADRSQQPKWNNMIAEELQKLNEYENKQIKIKW